MAKIVGDVTRAIEAELKSKLKNTASHLGFCLALSEVNIRLGIDGVVFDPSEPGTIEVLDTGPRVCPDCGAEMKKRRATLASGEPRVAWICECNPGDPSEPEPDEYAPDVAVAGEDSEDL